MRHRKSGRRLNRTSAHRKALFANLSASLFRHEQIKTTLPKAKELRRVAEPLITLAKTPSLANRRTVYSRLREHEVVTKLFDELGPHFADRPGGYLRILKCGHRPGDSAPMAYVQLVDRDFAKVDGDAGDAKAADADTGDSAGKPAGKEGKKSRWGRKKKAEDAGEGAEKAGENAAKT